MISNLMLVAFGTGIFFGLLVSIVCLMAGVGLAWSDCSRTWHLHLLHHRCLRRSRCGEAVEQEEDECFGIARCPPFAKMLRDF